MTPAQPPVDRAEAARAFARPAAARAAAALAGVAVALPTLVASSTPPVTTFYPQATALGAWGLAVAVWAAWRVRAAPAEGEWGVAWPLLAVLGVVAGAALLAGATGALPVSLAGPPALAAVAAAVVLVAGAAAAHDAAVRDGFLAGLVVAGAFGAVAAVVQVFVPAWADGTWLARTPLPGRAVGNLRQPNHLATLLLWAVVAVVPLVERGRLPRGAGVAAVVLAVVAVELSGSRTGALGTVALALWGVLDRRLGRFARALLVAAPLVYALAWAGFALAGHFGLAPVGAATRGLEGDLSSSRLAIWSNALALVAMHPWTGVGFGRFNFAWTLTPFPDRPTAFFDHAHLLPLHFAVELGLPLAALLTALLALALWRAVRAAFARGDVAARALAVMLLLVGAHSLLEYPLWYLHFLLPTAWAFGLCLAATRPAAAASRRRAAWLAAGGAAMVLAAFVAAADYRRVARIFVPSTPAAPLAQRIADGQRSPLFAHHADYAAATTGEPQPALQPAAQRAAHHLLDARLMMAWARIRAAGGELDHARHLAQRLREFRPPAARAFFAPCDEVPAPEPLPFQCQPPQRPLRWQDFEGR